ncbi:MAG: insulinase family protein, partial [Oscillospiraceae bacterium]|nr:insulinase family protein [Oscillospiraceae bacterium]
MSEIIASGRINEQYRKILHSSGLTILLYPMQGFTGSYALFATNYGSVDETFKTKNDDSLLTVPAGIAHFLEHKLFESEEGDAFSRFAKTGASPNAYTSFDRTAYLFSCSENFKESIEILLDFVTHPWFTPETVEKEQGIIGQEIRMYDDDPDWRVYFNLLGALYSNHPVRTDIAGT